MEITDKDSDINGRIDWNFNHYWHYKKLCEKPTPLGVGWIAQNIKIMCI